MAKSKRKHKKAKSLSSGVPPVPDSLRKQVAQAGLEHVQFRAFRISDDVDDNYRSGITDEIGEATLALKQGQVHEAIVAFQNIIKREPGAKEAYLNLAAAYKLSGQDETTAEALFQETMEKFPRYVFPRANLAQIYLKRGQVKEAEELLLPLDNLRDFTSGEFRFYALTWSDVLAAQGNYEAAMSWLQMLSSARPGSPGVWGRRVRYWIGRLLRGSHPKEQE
ncbi:MAG: tetratricopeptide repeat protein [Thermoflexales bacterium]|nr:tetratricopeptide repeat protein [Thermoflexales bacterium]